MTDRPPAAQLRDYLERVVAWSTEVARERGVDGPVVALDRMSARQVAGTGAVLGLGFVRRAIPGGYVEPLSAAVPLGGHVWVQEFTFQDVEQSLDVSTAAVVEHLGEIAFGRMLPQTVAGVDHVPVTTMASDIAFQFAAALTTTERQRLPDQSIDPGIRANALAPLAVALTDAFVQDPEALTKVLGAMAVSLGDRAALRDVMTLDAPTRTALVANHPNAPATLRAAAALMDLNLHRGDGRGMPHGRG